MVNITLSVDERIHKKMSKYSEIKWNEIARRAIERKINELEIEDDILGKSKLTDKDVKEISERIKRETFQELNEFS